MGRFLWLVVGLALLVQAGCAGTLAAPTVDISGKWQGTWTALNPAQGAGQIQMEVKQTGWKYAGNLLVTGAPNDPTGLTEGFVSGNQVRIAVPAGTTGTLTVNGDEMTGTLDGVSCLSGFAGGPGRAPLAFAILMNAVPQASAGEARRIQDQIAERLVSYLESTP